MNFYFVQKLLPLFLLNTTYNFNTNNKRPKPDQCQGLPKISMPIKGVH